MRGMLKSVGFSVVGAAVFALGGCAVQASSGDQGDEQVGEGQEALCGIDMCCGPTCLPEEDPCGDGICNNGETAADCPHDCRGTCGDGICNRTYKTSSQRDSYQNCPHDCTSSNYSTWEVCGDGYKSAHETCYNCAADVPSCPSYKASYGPMGGTETSETGCSYLCQSCTIYYQNPSYSYAGRCVNNRFGGLTCAYYIQDSCYNMWMCC